MEAGYALDLVQSDHTLVDIIVVDDLYRQPIGRPWVTLMIDVASRTVPGFHLDLLAPSAVAVAKCMRHAVLPKQDWLAERGMRAPWLNRASRGGLIYLAFNFARDGDRWPRELRERVQAHPEWIRDNIEGEKAAFDTMCAERSRPIQIG